MHLLDWLVIIIPILIILTIGVLTQRQMKSVAHFISGGRVGGRYILAVAKGEMQAGAVVFVAMWEMFAQAGFIPTWWGWITTPALIIVGIFGFVIYRFRETRAMTLAQFFEMRYSRNFRLFAGVLGFLAGIINFGIIPAVGARFMVYFLQLPPELQIGSWTLPTYILLMAIFLSIAIWLVISGGLITLMVTDCVEGIFSQLIYLVLIVAVLWIVDWSQMSAFIGVREPDHSLINPFDAWAVQDFNVWYMFMAMFIMIYGTMAWQNSSAYNTAGATPHEARMAGLLGRWREMGKMTVVTLLALAGLTYLGNADFATASEVARESIASIGQEQIQKQMTIPVALSHMLPIGVKGALCAVLLMGIFGGDSTHLHSWGGILAQDVILPRMKKAPSPKNHIRLLRWCSIFVAVFAFFFGVFFTQTEYIVMWWSVTTAVYVGGAGAAIIGGLYWKRGTSAGAWTAMIVGSVLSGGGILVSRLVGTDFLSRSLQAIGMSVPDFKLNGMQISFFATLIAITCYVVVSLLTCRQLYPLNKMLHREENVQSPKRRWTISRILGIDSDFSTGDKWISGVLFGWAIFWFLVVILGTAWNALGHWGQIPWIKPWSNEFWLGFWHVTAIGLPILVTVVTSIWFTFGGIHDIRALFRSLKSYHIDNADNGRVKEHKPW